MEFIYNQILKHFESDQWNFLVIRYRVLKKQNNTKRPKRNQNDIKDIYMNNQKDGFAVN